MQEGKQKNFFQRHFKGIAMAVITTIPTIYTTLFLGSMWDPYGNVSDLPVAVVNLDQPVDYAGSTMAVGDELVDNLKESDALCRCARSKRRAIRWNLLYGNHHPGRFFSECNHFNG